MQAVGAGLASDSDLIKESAFKEYVAGLVGHTAVLATHYAGNGQSAGMVCNHQRVAAQGDFLAVEQYQLLAFFSHAYTNAAIDLGKVERVQRLTQFQHDIVGNVDSGIDAAHVSATQALNHPQRRWPGQVDIADHTAQVARASSRCQHFNRTHFLVYRSNWRNHRASHLGVIQSAHFTRQTCQRQAVATVRREVDFDAGVFKTQVHTNVFAHRRISRQLHQAVIALAHLQLCLRAQHAVGLNATQLGLLDLEVARQFSTDHGERDFQARAHVGRAAHYLKRLGTIADLANAQLVGIWVLLGAQHLAHHHTTEYTGGRRNAVDLKTGHRQTSNQLVATYLRVYPTTQPLFTEFHPALLRIRYD